MNGTPVAGDEPDDLLDEALDRDGSNRFCGTVMSSSSRNPDSAES